MELVETSIFTKQVTALLNDEEYGEFQAGLAANPGLGLLSRVVGAFARFAWRLADAVSVVAPG